MSSEKKDFVQSGYPTIQVVSSACRSSDSKPTIIPMSIIPVYKSGKIQSVNITKQGLTQGSSSTSMKESSNSPPTSGVKRKHEDEDSPTLQHRAPHSYLMQQHALQASQPRTLKGKVYCWMQNGLPKRQRAQITDVMKKEILEFCNSHPMLKQGEIAEIFGVDRTTVSKMVKKSQETDFTNQSFISKPRLAQHELEDFLFRWMNSALKQCPTDDPVWSCDQLLEQATELQTITDAGHGFLPSHDWILDFVRRFRLMKYITDFVKTLKKVS